MRIVKIERYGRDPNRCILHTDCGTEAVVYADIVIREGLCTGAELTEEQWEEISAETAKLRTKRRAAAMLGRRPLSHRELVKKLCEKGESREDAEEAAEWLEELELLDDRQYADTVVRYYLSRGYGPGRISDELYRRGVGREEAKEALEGLEVPDETIDRLLRSKVKPGRDPRRELKRAADSLYRKGFSWSDIKAAVRRFEIDRLSEEDDNGL